MADQNIFHLNDGYKMPRLGLGLWQVSNEQAPDIVCQAIRTGYKLIDKRAQRSPVDNGTAIGNLERLFKKNAIQERMK